MKSSKLVQINQIGQSFESISQSINQRTDQSIYLSNKERAKQTKSTKSSASDLIDQNNQLNPANKSIKLTKSVKSIYSVRHIHQTINGTNTYDSWDDPVGTYSGWLRNLASQKKDG